MDSAVGRTEILAKCSIEVKLCLFRRYH